MEAVKKAVGEVENRQEVVEEKGEGSVEVGVENTPVAEESREEVAEEVDSIQEAMEVGGSRRVEMGNLGNRLASVVAMEIERSMGVAMEKGEMAIGVQGREVVVEEEEEMAVVAMAESEKVEEVMVEAERVEEVMAAAEKEEVVG